jgi:hypothetical protein
MEEWWEELIPQIKGIMAQAQTKRLHVCHPFPWGHWDLRAAENDANKPLSATDAENEADF